MKIGKLRGKRKEDGEETGEAIEGIRAGKEQLSTSHETLVGNVRPLMLSVVVAASPYRECCWASFFVARPRSRPPPLVSGREIHISSAGIVHIVKVQECPINHCGPSHSPDAPIEARELRSTAPKIVRFVLRIVEKEKIGKCPGSYLFRKTRSSFPQ